MLTSFFFLSLVIPVYWTVFKYIEARLACKKNAKI
uniref:Uncharacterized protein n=1 Tax=Tetranychus urticae TaxID=32264 RepID=T1JX56_TETUR